MKGSPVILYGSMNLFCHGQDPGDRPLPLSTLSLVCDEGGMGWSIKRDSKPVSVGPSVGCSKAFIVFLTVREGQLLAVCGIFFVTHCPEGKR